ncbi:MAG: CHAT domain-containing protein [Ardenticatenaceae bacterium]|nr:CHAT domain-containing protein [Ardenticatenaceae bacterium]
MATPNAFSEKFITVDTSMPAHQALELAQGLQPEYVVASQADSSGRLDYYIVKQELFLALARHLPGELDTPLHDFLALRPADAAPALAAIADPTRDDRAAEEVGARLDVQLGTSRRLGLVVAGDSPRAVYDPQRSAPNAYYAIPGRGFDNVTWGRQAAAAPRPEVDHFAPPPPPGAEPEPALTPVSRRGEPEGRKRPSRPGEIVRYPEATLPERLTVGKFAPLRVVITPRVVAGATGLVLRTPKGHTPPDAFEVMVFLEAPAFEIAGERFGTISVPTVSRDSDPLFFNLRPKPDQLGPQTVKLQFSQIGGGYLGELILTTQVVPIGQSSSSTTARAQGELEVSSTVRRDPDLTLMIVAKDPATREFEFILTSPADILDLFCVEQGEFRFASDPDQQFRQLFQEIEKPNPNLSPEDFAAMLAEKGRLLYQELFSEALKALYWSVRERINSIQIVSEEPWIPWEIVKPWRMNDQTGAVDEDEFLCERYVIARWLKGRNLKAKNKISRIQLVVPEDSGLVHAYRERQWLEQFAGERQVASTPTSSRQELLTALATGGFDLLHFACHGIFNPDAANKSTLSLQARQPFAVEAVSGLAAKFGFDNPIIFLNACQSGRQGYGLTGIGSWARQFLSVRCAAFIGSLWSVDDDLAFKFTETFYTRLAAGASLGTAVREARLAVKAERPADPTYLAYALYADPGLTVEFGA